MSNLRQAAEMVIEALINAYDAFQDGDSKGCEWILHEQITALRQALDQLPDTTKMIEVPPNSTTDVVEPVVWVNADNLQGLTLGYFGCAEIYTDESQGRIPLYTAPPKREWVGLTDEDILEAANIDGADTWVFETAYAIEAKLKEKNHG